MKKQRIIIDYVKNEQIIKEVALANNFVFRAYEIFRCKKFKKDEHLNNIIKVILTEDQELEQLQNGIEYNGKKYVQLITSPSMQKKEESSDDDDDEQTYKTEFLFIAEEDKDFVRILEMILSGDKIKYWEDEKMTMCLVKDIVARMGLATSGTTQINYNPRIVIVEEGSYTYKNNYTILENGEFKEVDNFEREHILNDGGGLMSDYMADIIAKEMKLDYRVDFAVIRQYKALAVKGLVLRFNFIDYMKENYYEDTDYFRCNNGVYEIKDIFNKWNNIENIDLLLNKSMVKWIKNWNSMNEIEEEYSKDKYKTYLSILDCIYVTKTNHNPKELKNHTKINYQVLQNVCCTAKDLEDMAEDTIKYYKKLVDLEKWDIDSIRIAMGDIASESGETTITNKLDFLLKKMGEDALKLRYVKSNIAKTVNKKIKQLSGGKMYLKGGYKLGALDPITYCNWLMKRDRRNNGLKENEFYIAGETGTRVFYRNPIALYQEIKQITLSNKLDRWLSDYTPELIFFNGFDDTLFQASTADLDGDGFGVIENDILYDCVIKEEHPFINVNDGESVEHEFTREQLAKDIIASSGNVIGAIAISNSKLCSEVTRLDNIILNHKNAYTYNQIKAFYFKDKGYEVNDDTEKEQIKQWNKEFSDKFNEMKKDKKRDILTLDKFNNTSKRELLTQLFYSHKEEFFNILYASQLAIDMPKTLTPIPKEIMKKLDKYMFIKKPVFMHYLDKCNCKNTGNKSVAKCKDILRWTKNGKEGNVKKASNVMDAFCEYIVQKLFIEDIKQIKGQENSRKLIKLMDYKCENGKVNEELESIYSIYKEKRNFFLAEGKKEGVNNEENNMKLNLIDKETLDAVENLNIIDEDVVVTLKDIGSVTARFIMIFLWNTLNSKISERNLCNLVTYREDEEGEIDWLFKKYLKINNPNLMAEYDEMLKLKKDLLKKIKQGSEIRVGGYKGITITDEMYVRDKHLFRVVDNINVRYIFDYEKKDLVDGQVLKVVDSNIANTGKSVTLFLEC
ncbi:RNA dependent RNA polymerase [Clostridium cagae]|uniref:RNA dependent RNA polymerase n=1 Tax=Clostridium cagae TaxID=2080751 RepID=UPI003F7606BC